MDETDDHDSRASWIRLAVTLLIAAVGNVGMWSIIVILPAVSAEFGLGRADASLPYAATMVGFAVGNLALGRAMDRIGIVRALSLAALGSGAGYALSALAPTAGVLIAVQLLIGFCSAVSFGPLIADISHWFLRRRGIAVAIAASGNYLSGAIWPVVLAPLLAAEGWRAVNLALAVIIVAVIVPAAQFLRREVNADTSARAAAHAASRARAVNLSPRAVQGLLALAGIACCVAMSMPQVHIVALCVDLGYGAAAGAEMLSLMLMGGVVSRLASGLLADRLGGLATLLIGSTLQCIALFLYLPAGGLASLYLVSLIFGLAQGGIVPSYALVVREFMPPREAGARVGLVIMATILGMALGGWMSGWIHDVSGSYRLAFLNGIAWNALNLAIAVSLFLMSRGRRAAPG